MGMTPDDEVVADEALDELQAGSMEAKDAMRMLASPEGDVG